MFRDLLCTDVDGAMVSAMSQARALTGPVSHLLKIVVSCGILVGCTAAPKATLTFLTASTAPEGPAAKTAVADVTVMYKGIRILDSRIATFLDQEARIDTVMDDGHKSVLKVTIGEDGAGHYKTAVDVVYDGAAIASTGFLSSPGQSAVAESADVQVTLRVSAGS